MITDMSRIPLGHHTARVAANLESRGDREIVFFLHAQAHRLGGLNQLAQDLVVRLPRRFGSITMYENRFEECFRGSVFRAVAEECGTAPSSSRWAIEQSIKAEDFRRSILPDDEITPGSNLRKFQLEHAKDEGPASFFWDACRELAIKDLPARLNTIVGGGQSKYRGMSYFDFPPIHDFRGLLIEYRDLIVKEERQGLPVTSIGERIFDDLDFALEAGGLVVVEGPERIGKTEAAKHWHRLNMGRSRFVSLECGQSDLEFFKCLSDGIFGGYTEGLTMGDLKIRIKSALSTGDLVLIIDESQWAVGSSKQVPKRIAWLLTALVNYGIPVALIATPQFASSVQANAKRSGWRVNQFVGRVQHYDPLPEELTEEDLLAVAAYHLPDGEKDSHEFLAAYAGATRSYLQGISRLVKRARWEVKKLGRDRVEFEDLEMVAGAAVRITEAALDGRVKGAKIYKPRANAETVQASRKAPAQPLHHRCREDEGSVSGLRENRVKLTMGDAALSYSKPESL